MLFIIRQRYQLTFYSYSIINFTNVLNVYKKKLSIHLTNLANMDIIFYSSTKVSCYIKHNVHMKCKNDIKPDLPFILRSHV